LYFLPLPQGQGSFLETLIGPVPYAFLPNVQDERREAAAADARFVSDATGRLRFAPPCGLGNRSSLPRFVLHRIIVPAGNLPMGFSNRASGGVPIGLGMYTSASTDTTRSVLPWRGAKYPAKSCLETCTPALTRWSAAHISFARSICRRFDVISGSLAFVLPASEGRHTEATKASPRTTSKATRNPGRTERGGGLLMLPNARTQRRRATEQRID
jgi:hypothetical protein